MEWGRLTKPNSVALAKLLVKRVHICVTCGWSEERLNSRWTVAQDRGSIPIAEEIASATGMRDFYRAVYGK